MQACLLTTLRALVLRPDSWISAAVMLTIQAQAAFSIRDYSNPALIYSERSLITTRRRAMTTTRPCRWPLKAQAQANPDGNLRTGHNTAANLSRHSVFSVAVCPGLQLLAVSAVRSRLRAILSLASSAV